jgi:hydrogenase nickel incorporation protein HypA/HybF
MHELPATQNILDIAINHGKKNNALRILQLNIVIGQLSSFIDDSIQFYWDLISKDTIAEGATLNIVRIPAEFSCLDCHNNYALSPDGFECPECGSSHVEILNGKEFYLKSIDIE